MKMVTIHLPDEQYERLKTLAGRRGVSLNKLIEEFATRALSEVDVEARFQARAARGDPKRGLALLDTVDGAE